MRQLTVLDEVDSTNRYLGRLPPDQQHGHAVVADRQTQGQGRQGRNWHSPPGSNVYLSLGWAIAEPGAHLARLPLAIAVFVARAIEKTGVPRSGIKWPNDVQIEGRKVAGILVELRPRQQGGSTAVIGVGVNVSMPADDAADKVIGQNWTDLASHIPGSIARGLRDQFCALLLGELLSGLVRFTQQGFEALASDWAERDVLSGQWVTVFSQNREFGGKVTGFSEQGGLLLELQDESGSLQTREFFAGDVSIRPGSEPQS